MKHQLKLAALCAGMILSLPSASALNEVPIQAAFKYDASMPVSTTYRRAMRTASKACGLHGRVTPIRRSLTRNCVRPLIEEFVIATRNSELIAYHERRTGRKLGNDSSVAN
ncbi:MAG: hypothetical protein AAFW60_04680, partial [Pseudomonadota bacterium]